MTEFFKRLQADRAIDVAFWKKHPELRDQLIDKTYPDKAHVIFELLQNAEDKGAANARFTLLPDRLVFIHDGKPFTEKNIESITDWAKSDKEKGEIGKFGVGFKSVFKYTDTPEIHSANFSFRIKDDVYPEEVKPLDDIGQNTTFIFPFNTTKNPASAAYRELDAGLNELGETPRTLLFLNTLKSISWQIGKIEPRGLERVSYPHGHIQIQRLRNGRRDSSFHFLRFVEPVNGEGKRHLAIAFELEFLPRIAEFDPSTDLSRQMKVATEMLGTVAVYFPAKSARSGLRFHVHAPFATPPNRASISDAEENKSLYEQLGTVAAKSLHTIRNLGLLTEEFLAVLPNNDDNLESWYQPIRTAVLDEMIAQPLTPTPDDQHFPARRLIRAKPILRTLLSELSKSDLAFIVGATSQDIQWAMDLGGTGLLRQRQLLKSLAVRSFDDKEFLQRLDEGTQEIVFRQQATQRREQYPRCIDWLCRQPLVWHQKLYCWLNREILRPPTGPDPLHRLQIIRLQSTRYEQGGKCFFPTDKFPTDAETPLVDKQVFSSCSLEDNLAAKRFLERVGVKDIEEKDLIQRDLKRRYSFNAKSPDDETYRADLMRFMQFLARSPSDSQIFSEASIFKTKGGTWAKPKEVFLDLPYKETLLAAYYDSIQDVRFAHDHRVPMPLSHWYHDQEIADGEFVSFAESVGVRLRLRVVEVKCIDNPEWERLQTEAPGGTWSEITGEDRDWDIPSLQLFLSAPALPKSKLIWRVMCAEDPSVLTAVYQRNRQQTSATVDSQLVKKLRYLRWVPQKQSNDEHAKCDFVRPAQASRSRLPPGFPFDSGHEWLRKIGFEDDAEQEAKKKDEEYKQRGVAANVLGWPEEGAGDVFVQLRKKGWTIDDLKQLLIADQQPCELPVNAPQNPERRAERVYREAANAPKRMTKEVTRSVAVGLDKIQQEAAQYLRHQYTNDSGKMSCQVCKKELPFKLDKGTYYFEMHEFLNELPRRHYQNYLALCPNHWAMFQHANGSRDKMKALFEALEGDQLELEVVLAQRDHTIYFTKTHHQDLLAVIAASRAE